MRSPRDADAFETRVNFAASYIAQGRPATRRFDTCFEMYDGDYVAEALYRRVLAHPNSQLAKRIWSYIGRELVERNHEKLKNIPRRKLASAAAEHRAMKAAEFEKWLARQQPNQP